MKTTLKTEEVLVLYRTLNTSKYAKLSDSDKIKVWKIVRALKPVATQFEEDSKDAADKLKPYEEFQDDLQKAQDYEQKKGVGCEMTIDDYQKFMAAFKAYNKNVEKALKEFAEKEVTLEYDAISEEAFTKLMDSNDWNFGEAVNVGGWITE